MKLSFTGLRFSVFLAFLLCSIYSNAQEGPVHIVSPEVAGFAKSGNIPVSTYTGTPNISVPLFSIEDGDISLPISLSYNPSGIKVQEEATWVGLGFCLNAGGQITRAIRGKDDFQANSGYNNYISSQAINDKPLFSYGMGGLTQRYAEPQNPCGSPPIINCHLDIPSHAGSVNWMDLNFNPYLYDWTPDIFHFTAGNNSGRFVFNDDGVPITLKKSNTKISLFNGTDFQITTGDGLIYTYSLEDRNSPRVTIAPDFISTWYLTQIRSANGNNVVNFIYGGGSLTTNPVSGTSATIDNNGSINTYELSNYTDVAYRYLTEIDFKGGKILFQSSANRTDVTGERRLDSLVQYDSTGLQVRKYSFKYSYFHSTEFGSMDGPLFNDRLKLDTILINDDITNSYKFDYNMDNVPSKKGGKDHWGYYNKAGFGIPQGIYEYPVAGTGLTAYQLFPGGGDYEAHWPYTQAMILNKLTYPTGGYSKFTYESNEFGNVPDYWQYEIATNNSSTVLIYPITSVDNGSVAVTGTLDDSHYYNLYCHFYCPTPDDLGNFYVELKTTGGTLVNRYTLTDFTTANGRDYYLNANNLAMTGDLVCTAYSERANFALSTSDFFQFFVLNLTAINISPETSLTYKNVTRMSGGGLRIRKIVNGDLIKETSFREYTYNKEDGSSSGTIMNYPAYMNYPASRAFNAGNYTYAYFSSSSSIGLSTSASGNFIGYDRVKEYIGDSASNIGTSVYEYMNFPDTKPFWQYGTDLPCLQTVENGLPLKTIHYNVSNAKVSISTYTYNTFDTAWNSTTGVQLQPVSGDPSGGVLYFPVLPTIYFWRDYQLDYKLLNQTDTVFDGSDQELSVQTVTQYQYAANANPRKVLKSNSKGTQDQTEYRYADDFTAGTVPVFVQEMKDSNILDKPVETIQSKVSEGSNLATGGLLNEYGTGSNRGLIMNQYALRIAAPMPWVDTNFSSSLSNSSLIFNSKYSVKNSFNYLKGNVTDYKNEDHPAASYLWGYIDKYPIAECINATSSEFFSENFEENPSMSVVTGVAHTGNKFYNGAYTVSWTKPNSRTYRISYWYRSGENWKFSGMQPYSGPTLALTGGDAYDDVRIYPTDAQMNTYTYQPFVGMTSRSDVNNRVTYYEYDLFQRLKRIRDQDHNILKTYEYQYQAPSGCGSNCFIVAMQTFSGSNTLSYPVGVFNANGKLLGNATNQAGYISLWNADTANSNRGTLATGADSMHFQITLNTGKTLPSITGCRYYQVDLSWNMLDGLRNYNAAYVDFGDGTGMYTGKGLVDTPAVLAAGTTYHLSAQNYRATTVYEMYYKHTYADTSLKTLTFYHNDADETEDFDNVFGDATSLTRMKNLRGYLPQHTVSIGGSSYQQSTMTSVAAITNWNSLQSVQYFRLNNGDRLNPCKNIGYTQDFMQNNKGLIYILTTFNPTWTGLRDTSFKLTRLKSDWNTYFTNLQYLYINDDHWKREDLSALKKLQLFVIYPTNQDHQDYSTSPLITIPSAVIDSILIQIAAGAGQSVYEGIISITSGGPSKTSISDPAVGILKNKRWQITINGAVL